MSARDERPPLSSPEAGERAAVLAGTSTGSGAARDVAPNLERIDAGLLRLRALVIGSPAPSGALPGESVDMSTVRVVDVVVRSGEDAVSIGAIAAELGITASTTTRLVDRAVAAGMVERERSTTDGRGVKIRVTDAGAELDLRALRFRVDRLAAMLADWTPERIHRFAHDLDEFADAASGARDKEQ
ncbi:MarR family winged helix-turn-helix transcriptional regulator [Demequina sp. NBRC 110056]|uniref:MarR family winged helix-turn-helix transcriptional regulator n=1 Tax=Demequina sp. NBRC 110056 TaxID=1570345 RepID=UPI0009FBA497|nr:MarR family winged helix-turn-helix transcriptional regulator [Demequina sp. NBRC 110056]